MSTSASLGSRGAQAGCFDGEGGLLEEDVLPAAPADARADRNHHSQLPANIVALDKMVSDDVIRRADRPAPYYRGAVRLLAATIGAFTGVGLGLMLSTENWGGLLVAGLCVLVLVAAVRRLDAASRGRVALIVAVSFALRLGLGQAIYWGSMWMGHGGFVTGDDTDYALMARAVSGYLLGQPLEPFVPPLWAGNDYLVGTYVYMGTAVFLLVGPNVPVVLVLNAAFASAGLILLFDLGRRLFGLRAGALAASIVAVYPSLVLWSSLNLKDAVAFLLSAMVLWFVTRAVAERRFWLALASYVVLIPLEGMRRYLFISLAVLVPIIFLTSLSGGRRWRWSAVAAIASVVLLLSTGYSAWLSPTALNSLEAIRAAMAIRARTGYYQPTTVSAGVGSTFVVPGSGPAEVVHVPEGARIVLSTCPPAPVACPSARAGEVRPGSIVVVGPPETTPAPMPARRPLGFTDLTGPEPAVQLASDAPATSERDGLVLQRTIAHIPRGLAYALAAPFPWAAERVADLVTIPEMLLWYLSVVAGLWTCWVYRSRWRKLLAIVLLIIELIGIFVLAEGNVGILFRHRGMVIPYVILLAAPTFLTLARSTWVDRFSRARVTAAS